MSKEIVVAEGLFSKVSITLKDETVNKLAFIRKKDNPLASIEQDLRKTLDDFERRYFEITHPKPVEGTEGSNE